MCVKITLWYLLQLACSYILVGASISSFLSSVPFIKFSALVRSLSMSSLKTDITNQLPRACPQVTCIGSGVNVSSRPGLWSLRHMSPLTEGCYGVVCNDHVMAIMSWPVWTGNCDCAGMWNVFCKKLRSGGKGWQQAVRSTVEQITASSPN